MSRSSLELFVALRRILSSHLASIYYLPRGRNNGAAHAGEDASAAAEMKIILSAAGSDVRRRLRRDMMMRAFDIDCRVADTES